MSYIGIPAHDTTGRLFDSAAVSIGISKVCRPLKSIASMDAMLEVPGKGASGRPKTTRSGGNSSSEGSVRSMSKLRHLWPLVDASPAGLVHFPHPCQLSISGFWFLCWVLKYPADDWLFAGLECQPSRLSSCLIFHSSSIQSSSGGRNIGAACDHPRWTPGGSKMPTFLRVGSAGLALAPLKTHYQVPYWGVDRRPQLATRISSIQCSVYTKGPCSVIRP